ncbi:MAG: hypothetical protein FWF82_03275 [Oscillospiraceae bacterium]|nr:hypothetical protein [Oscillospiraceae bacterium]
MPVSKAQRKSNAKHDKENFQYFTVKARTGSRDQIKKAAEATNQSVNGFIRNSLNKAVEEAIGEPMEKEKANED